MKMASDPYAAVVSSYLLYSIRKATQTGEQRRRRL